MTDGGLKTEVGALPGLASEMFDEIGTTFF
jgi:hypothetical protein